MGNRDRVIQDVDDIRDADGLIRYAVAARLAYLDVYYDINQSVVARATGIGEGNLSSALSGRSRLSDAMLSRLDEAIIGLEPDTDHGGGLSSLPIRLRGLTGRASLVARIPPSWTWEMLQDPPRTEFGVLIQSSALLSMFLGVGQTERGTRRVRQQYAAQISKIMEQLIPIGVAPPTPRNIDALLLLGGLGKYSFDVAKGILEGEIRKSPLGFRVWRAVTNLVQLSKDDSALVGNIKPWVKDLLEAAEGLREKSAYPGRSLDLELAISIPPGWSPPGQDDWVRNVLLTRAKNRTATIRERGTAALGLWQRAFDIDPDNLDDVKEQLRGLIGEFASSDARKDAAGGMQWVAATLRHVIDNTTAVCNHWPDTPGAAWLAVVHDAAESLGNPIPDYILPATKKLFRHMLLQNHGVKRRHAIDTLVAGGWVEPITQALEKVLLSRDVEAWLRVRVLFALGFLQQRDETVARILTTACNDAHAKLIAPDRDPTSAEISEMHAALFALGDCFGAGFGAPDVPGATRIVRRETEDTLRDLVTGGQISSRERHLIARAVAYLLTVSAQDQEHNQKDISQELLEELGKHPDEVTREFSKWALSFRFGKDGRVQPLMQAVR
jgi:hypothetical protein